MGHIMDVRLKQKKIPCTVFNKVLVISAYKLLPRVNNGRFTLVPANRELYLCTHFPSTFTCSVVLYLYW